MSLLTVYQLERIAAWDRLLCRRFNRMAQREALRIVLVAASRLGDGVFWYVLMLALLVANGARVLPALLHMLGAGLVCNALYKAIKARTSRRRPYEIQPEVVLLAAPLDRYSFPSGHTLHAVSFSLVSIAYYPALVWLVAPFALLVALSRVVLGLHYPTDVIAGALIGAAIAELCLLV